MTDWQPAAPGGVPVFQRSSFSGILLQLPETLDTHNSADGNRRPRGNVGCMRRVGGRRRQGGMRELRRLWGAVQGESAKLDHLPGKCRSVSGGGASPRQFKLDPVLFFVSIGERKGTVPKLRRPWLRRHAAANNPVLRQTPTWVMIREGLPCLCDRTTSSAEAVSATTAVADSSLKVRLVEPRLERTGGSACWTRPIENRKTMETRTSWTNNCDLSIWFPGG